MLNDLILNEIHERRFSSREIQSILYSAGRGRRHWTSFPAHELEDMVRTHYNRKDIFYKTFDCKTEELVFVTQLPIRVSRFERLKQFILGQ